MRRDLASELHRYATRTNREAMLMSPFTASDYRVLIVDDEPAILDAVSDYLTAYGFPMVMTPTIT